MARDRDNVVDRCVDRGIEHEGGIIAGARLGGRVAVFVAQWCHFIEHHDGREPTMIEFAEYVGRNRQATYDTLGEFRELFPEYETPAPFVGVPLGSRGLRLRLPDHGPIAA